MPSIKQIENGLLFLEDIGEHPYKIDRMLHQLNQAGYLANQQAVMLGDFSHYKLTEYDQAFNLENVWQDWQKKLPHVKFLKKLNFGHCYDKLCLKIGQNYTINIMENTNLS
jgi:muramoyltetrapeptide carboxypeptidase